MKRFVLKMLKGNEKEYLLMISVLSLIVSFLYVFLSLYDVMSIISGEFSVFNMRIDMINFIALGLSIITIIIVNHYFIEERTQEYALLLLTGRGMKDIVFYILMQFGSILMIAFIIGGLFGALWIILLNVFYQFIQIDFVLAQPFIGFYILMFIVCVIIVLATNIARFNKIEININDYLRNKVYTSSHVPPKKTKEYGLFSILGALCILNSYNLTLENETSISSIVSFIGVIAGIMLLATSVIPFIYYTFHRSIVLKGKNIMFIFNGFMELISTLQFSFILDCLMIPILLISILTLDINSLKYVMITCYIFVLVMIMICFILQLNLYSKGLSFKINTLKSLGYKKNNVRTIQFVQIMMFLLVVLLPLIAFSHLLIRGYNQGVIDIWMLGLVIGSYICIYLFICIYMGIKFNSIIKEAY
ncbi:MAG: FtsX-like permease family protein [Bacilli bacterium]|nr:FtsX-like permease family protein [Bacilli bacterium]